MNFDEYQELCLRTSNSDLSEVTAKLVSALGLAGEAGEVADYLKKVYGHGHELDLETLKKEIGDCVWYCADLCSKFGLSLNEVVNLNIEKLKARYPNGFSEEKSKNRKPGDT